MNIAEQSITLAHCDFLPFFLKYRCEKSFWIKDIISKAMTLAEFTIFDLKKKYIMTISNFGKFKGEKWRKKSKLQKRMLLVMHFCGFIKNSIIFNYAAKC